MQTSIWYNIVVTRNGSNGTVYINTTIDGTFTNSTNLTQGQLRLCRNINEPGGYSGGKLSNVLMYNRALTLTEIQQNYNTTCGRFGLSPIPPIVTEGLVLHLDAGATLLGSTDINDFPVIISEYRSYTDNYTIRSLIYAENEHDIGTARYPIPFYQFFTPQFPKGYLDFLKESLV